MNNFRLHYKHYVCIRLYIWKQVHI